jgi:hypothetical protein
VAAGSAGSGRCSDCPPHAASSAVGASAAGILITDGTSANGNAFPGDIR